MQRQNSAEGIYFTAQMSERRLEEYKFRSRADRRQERAEEGVQLRKDKRDDQAMKKRNIDDSNAMLEGFHHMAGQELAAYLAAVGMRLDSKDPAVVHAAVVEIRSLLSRAENPPIDDICRSELVPRLVHLLHYHDYPDIQFEAAWAITNLASGNSAQTLVLIHADVIPILTQLLTSKNLELKEQCVWALGNIAGDGSQARDMILQMGAMTPLLKVLEKESKQSLLQNAAWTLSNLCRGKRPYPPQELIFPALPVLHRLIYTRLDEILIDACWALSYVSEGSNEKIKRVIDAGICNRLVELLLHPRWAVVKPALRTLGNIVTGNDVQTQVVLNAQALPNLLHCLSSPKDSIRREACWAISNIMAGPTKQIQAVIDANVVPALIKMMGDDVFKIRKEAGWAISNATSGGTPEQVRFLVQMGCLTPLVKMLDLDDVSVRKMAMDGIQNILQVGLQPDGNSFLRPLEEAQGIDRLNFMVMCENPEISGQAQTIIQRYIPEQDHAQGIMEPQSQFDFDMALPADRFDL